MSDLTPILSHHDLQRMISELKTTATELEAQAEMNWFHLHNGHYVLNMQAKARYADEARAIRNQIREMESDIKNALESI